MSWRTADQIGLTGLRKNTWPAEKKWPFSICLHLLSWKLRYTAQSPHYDSLFNYISRSLSPSLYPSLPPSLPPCRDQGQSHWCSSFVPTIWPCSLVKWSTQECSTPEEASKQTAPLQDCHWTSECCNKIVQLGRFDSKKSLVIYQ